MGMGMRGWIVTLGAACGALLFAAPAGASFGDLFYQSCDSGEDGLTACTEIPTAATSGTGSGLNNVADVAASPDGDHVYALSSSDEAVTRFDRDPATGALTFAECVTADLGATPACASTGANATATGAGSGLENPTALALSPNGESLYVASESDFAIVHFARETTPGPNYGDLTFLECITGDTAVAPAPCTAVAVATAGGVDSGMENLADIAVAPNGVYAVSSLDDAVVRLRRELADGDLLQASYQCISGDSGLASCTPSDDATAGGGNSGLDQVDGIAVSPDFDSVYTSSFSDHSVARFDRIAAGALDYGDCISGETLTVTTGCADNGFAASSGINSGLSAPFDIAVSPDSASVYVAASGDNGIAQLDRDTSDGTLTFEGCVTGETPAPANCVAIPAAAAFGANSGLNTPAAITLPPDGSSLYAAARDDSALATFGRDAASGDLTYQGCVSGETDVGTACTQIPSAAPTGTNSGLDEVGSQGTIAASPDGKSVYAAAFLDDAVADFKRENPPGTQINTGPSATTSDTTPSFTFSVTPPVDPTATAFECKVDSAGFGPCTDSTAPTGSHTTAALAEGPHSFQVRAVDSFGFADATPAASAFTVDIPDPPQPPAPTPDPPVATGDTDPPETTIASGPKKKSKKRKAKFEFSSDEAGSSFQCDLDDGGFEPCDALETFKVKRGKHTLQVRATDSAGNVDGSPAEQKWKVKKKN